MTIDKTASATNVGFITLWDKIKRCKEILLSGRLPSDLCNMPKFLLPGVNLHIKLTKDRSRFYLKNAPADSKTTFKFLDAKLYANPDLLSAHNTTLREGGIARYNLTSVELKTFRFAPGSKSLSIDNLVLGPVFFTMIKNTDFSRLYGD